MIKIKNIQTGEVVYVYQTGFNKSEGKIYCNGTPSAKYLAKYPLTATDEKIGEDTVLTVNEGWELLRGRQAKGGESNDGKKKAPKAKKEARNTQPATETTTTTDEAQAQPATTDATPKAPAKHAGRTATKKGVTNAATENDERNAEQALIHALKQLRGNAATVDAEAVRAIFADELKMWAQAQPTEAKKVALKVKKADAKEVYCAKFERIVSKVSRGNNVYLYGRAGSGKSHTAEQVAERLGLKFYGQTTIQFAHDVRGYGDAGGNFQATPFFMAFSQGGLYFQDEYDRSFPEAAVVLNSALANGWYDFPVVGRVEAHPDFRFMAAGNTLMKGADEEYVTGQTQDASCRDRFGFFFEVDYSHEVELHIAHGNAEIVEFVEDVRQAVRDCGLQHVVSYRATAAMTDEVENENDLEACVEECVFKGLERDAVREIYGRLQHTNNPWAKATANVIK